MHKTGKKEKVKPLYERHYQISSLLMVDCLTTIMTGILELFHTELLLLAGALDRAQGKDVA